MRSFHGCLTLFLVAMLPTVSWPQGPILPRKELLKNIEDNNEIIASMEMKKLVSYHCDKQVQIDTQAGSAIGKIRDAYVAKLAPIKDEAKAAGQIKVAADIEEILEDAGDLDSWAESFGVVEE